MTNWTPPNTQYPPPKPGEPPLHGAARLGELDEIRRLVSSGHDLEAVFDIALDPSGRECPATPLMVAAGSGDGATIETVALLLELGADPTRRLRGESAAMSAARGLGWNYRPGGDSDRLELLLSHGSPLPNDPHAANRVLCDTAGAGDAARLAVLLARGLDPDGHWHAEQARKEHAGLMQMTCADDDLFAALPDELRQELAEVGRSIENEMQERWLSGPSDLEIPLFRAAESGSRACVRLLLDAGADPAKRDNSRRTAMYSARSVDVVGEFLNAGLPIEDSDEYGWPPLVSALGDGPDGVTKVRALIECGADVNATHDRGYTVFMDAVGSGRYPEALRLLVEAGADPHAVSELGYNAFHAAIDVNFESNAEESVRDTLGYIKSLGVDIEQRNRQGQTPLARAIDEGTGLETQVLCELGANPDAACPMHQCGPESCGSVEMPLLFAASDGTGVHRDVKTRALLTAGADPLVTNDEGVTPLMCVVGALCSDADDYEGTYDRFFSTLRSMRLPGDAASADRDDFVAMLEVQLLPVIEELAAGIPISGAAEFADEWRRERINCIVTLCAFESWARHKRLRESGGSSH